MAETLRWPSKVKAQQKKLARTRGVKNSVLLLLALVCIAIGWRVDQPAWRGGLMLAGVALGIGGLVVLSAPTRRERALGVGHEGEVKVAEVLDRLPQGWFIINDITIRGSQIDHLAIGPGGLFCIETKHWNNARCDACGNWYRKEKGLWVPRKENPCRQNMTHVLVLKTFLRKYFGIDLIVESVIVLSNTSGIFDIHSPVVPPGKTRICWLPQLAHVLSSGSGSGLSPKRLQEMAKLLLRRSS